MATRKSNGMTPHKALRLAKEKAGGLGRLADVLKVTKQAIYQWKITPVRHVLAIEAATGVSRHDLRPDIYPRAK